MRRIKRTVRIQRLHYTTITNPHYRKTANAPKIPAPTNTTRARRAQILKVTVAQYLQRAKAKQEQQDLAYQAFQVNSTLIFAYKQLHHLIYTSCGRNTEEEFFAISGTSFRDEAVCQRIKDICGVEVSAKPDDENYMLVKLTDQAKVCKATTETGEMILDFPTLFKINHERRLLWQKYQNDFAKSCIDRCIVNLQNIRYKYLGIPRVITVRSQDNDAPFRYAIDFFPDNDTPFRDAIDFFPFLVEYCNLTAEQVFRLQENMNRLIAHANVEVWLASSPPYNMWIRITKNPDKDLAEAYFDYARFYSEYDNGVSEELQQFYKQIAANLRIASEKDQYNSLSLRKKLFYFFENSTPKWKDVQERLADGIHRQDLLDAINQHYKDIQVTTATCKRQVEPRRRSMRGCGGFSGDYYNERIEFTFKITNPRGEFACQFMKQLHRVEQLQIQARQLFVSQIVDYCLEDVEQSLTTECLSHLFHHEISSELPQELQTITLDGHEIKFKNLAQPLRNAICKGVNTESARMITLRSDGWYRLNFSLGKFS